MSNCNKVNSEMYSLTDGPYHCIVRESGEMYYCEVFRNDDLIFASTYEDLESAKIDCEIKVLADRFKAGLFSPIVFDFKDTSGKEDAIKRHIQAAKAVEDGCKAAAEQEPKYKWIMLANDYYHLSTDEFRVSVFTALDKWILRVTEKSSSLIVINSTLDECEDAKNMAEAFLQGYDEGPEAKLDEQELKSTNYISKEETIAFIKEAIEDSFTSCIKNGAYKWVHRPGRREVFKAANVSATVCRLSDNSYTYCVEKGDPCNPSVIITPNDRVITSLEAAKEEAEAAIGVIINADVEFEQPSPTEIEETVIAQIRKRRDVGREKYGTTMGREDLSFIQWLQHLQEELLDAAIYVEKLKREHRKELLSDMIADDENGGLYEA